MIKRDSWEIYEVSVFMDYLIPLETKIEVDTRT